MADIEVDQLYSDGLGHLNLTLLPSSDLQLSFTGDDGCSERLAILAVSSESSAVEIEKIAADASGRSFLVKLQGGHVSYFWCSEKSKLVGVELLSKMKDLLSRKPSLAELTGISETRLSCFAVHLRSYLLGPASAKQSDPTVSSPASSVTSSGLSEVDPNTQSSNSLKSSCGRLISSHVARSHLSLHQSSLSPRSNNFKEGFLKNTFLTRSGAREKFRQRGESHCGGSSSGDNMTVASISNNCETLLSALQQTESDNCPEHIRYCNYPPSSPETLNESLPLSLGLPSWHHLSMSQVPALRSSFSAPYSCWCPPCTPAFQYSITPNLPSKVTEVVSLPPLSTLLSAGRSSSSWDPPTASLDAADIPSLETPSFVPDPLVRLPLSVSPLISIPSSQQMLTFTPLMSDPIVHIPVIDVCSSGQGYLVSAGPAISTSISPSLPNLVSSRIPDSESVVEKNARETLRLLLSSTKSSSPLMDMLPAVPTNTDENISCIHVSGHNTSNFNLTMTSSVFCWSTVLTWDIMCFDVSISVMAWATMVVVVLSQM
ncbi:hypothetical protein ACLOJK_012464 [Asimina triloba]